ncbi:MAG: RNA methyltransferase [Deltaproteobacteria bacterium]|nr:MAG: RNA methyltransferase [Deltaproteobacteria bacterium]
MRESVYISLVHHPVYDRRKRVVTTSITNLDLHDLSRLARTFGLGGFFVVQPSPLQRKLAERIIAHWERGYGADYNVTRKEAFQLVTLAETVEEVSEQIEEREGRPPTIVATTGREFPNQVDYDFFRKELPERLPVLILFGTGWGLADELILSSHVILKPVKISEDYNHLSVRCAAAIILDRILGRE